MRHQAQGATRAMALRVDEWMRDPEAAQERSRAAIEKRDDAGNAAALRVINLWWGEEATTSYHAGDEYPFRVGTSLFQGPFVERGRGKTWREAVEAGRPVAV